MNRKEASEVIKTVSEKYPKFTKIQLCMIRNPEYGLRLAPEAERLLKEKGIPLTPQRRRTPQRKKAPEVPPKKRVSFRLSDAEYEKLKNAVKESGFRTTQEFMEDMIKRSSHAD